MELIGECKGNNGNGCFMDSSGHNCGCFTIKERSYSEEEVFKIVEQAIKDYNNKQLHLFDGSFSNPIYSNLEQWFEQFKNK